ncbi:hypothetical protein [Enterococcus mediterraneensis]|uniref:hypothetical protein n=1 Tax=Enterococcus mediterraneensis TaxID=2364791 RepID=UPI000F04ED5A|nr:hypothetical protein [Enterococcus mediterraneensis]
MVNKSNALQQLEKYFKERAQKQVEEKETAKRIEQTFLSAPDVNTAGWVAYQSLPLEKRIKAPAVGSKDEMYQYFTLHSLKELLHIRNSEAWSEFKTVEPYHLIHETAATNYAKLEKELADIETALQMLKEYEYPNTVTTFTESVAGGMDQFSVETAKQAAAKLQLDPTEFDNPESKDVK